VSVTLVDLDPVRHDPRVSRGELPDDFAGAVARAVVHGDQFEGVAAALEGRQEPLHRVGQDGLFVVAGHDN